MNIFPDKDSLQDSGYYGKYRALVVDTDDPEKMGRIRVECPVVYGDSASDWCMPCIPFAIAGGDFVLPPVGVGVWIEFENGDPDFPIYTGCWYAAGKSPLKDYSKRDKCRIIGFGGATITFNEDVMTIKSDGATFKFSSSNISKLNNL